ncbi:MAG TPA: phytanoyl-CoA dioxygenase family protein [Chthonomonadaceae bacterium]|nr:phytanoyl-CoA dioxygenase family protein [Chthonomonadaceae bacterium]
MPERDHAKRQQLLSSGYCVFVGVLDRPMLAELTQVTEDLLARQTPQDVKRYRYQGSNIFVAYQHSVFARLFAWPKALAALAALGFDAPKWWSAFLLSKPPHAPPLYWHQDWWAWDEPCSASEIPPQVFLMYYLTDTSVENGCLRILPGTHRRRIPLHDLLPAAHTDQTYEASLDSPLFMRHPDEVDVPVKAGDLVIGDARVLHAAHANQTDQRRTCLTLWYLPAYASLPDSIKAVAARKKPLEPPDWWEGEVGKRMEPLIPYYSGDTQPAAWNRNPGSYLPSAPIRGCKP